MIGELIMLPVRIGVRATRLWLRAAEETVTVAVAAGGRLIEMTSRGSGSEVAASPRESSPERDGAGDSRRAERRSNDLETIERDATVALRPSAPEAAPGAQPSPPEPSEPTHVSEEPALVEELADPGAADGAGAQIRIKEPWDGYAKMNAKEVVGRLGRASPAELAAVQLYESSHRNRQTVLNAVQRELRSANGRNQSRG